MENSNQVLSKNPATGETLQSYSSATLDEIKIAFKQAKATQKNWELVPTRTRAKMLLDLRETLIDQAENITEILHKENGKSKGEALTTEVIPCVDLLTYYSKNAQNFLKDKKIPLRLMKHRKSILNYWPLGTIAVISPWNYPLFLPFGDIVMAVVAGNSVILKPSEVTPWIGSIIPSLFIDSGFPKHLVQVLQGGGSVGANIIDQKPNKIFFTGSVETGKKIMAHASQNLTPVNLELGGKDPMIVFQDANIDLATSAALWGGFANAGQVCASIERLIIHESISDKFQKLLIDKTKRLRKRTQGSLEYDIGPITFEKQKEVYKDQFFEAKNMGAEIILGGEFSENGRFLNPTLINGNKIEETKVFNEETFGPIIAITTFKTPNEAIDKANRSKYGLVASIYSQNLSLAKRVARQLHAGTVNINEVLYTAGLPETPWGGVKETGIGRTHSEAGLLEFVNVRHIHYPIASPVQWKSPWWFPYSPHQKKLFEHFLELYRNSWFKKITALPMLLWHFIQMIKKEPRI